MTQSSLTRIFIGASALAVVSVASAQTIRRNTVIPIRFDDTIRLSNVRVGDTFRARTENSRDLPNGAQLEGRVRGVRKPRSGENGYVEMEFTTLRTSNGRRYEIRAVPVPLDDRHTTRDQNGRITIKQSNNGVNSGTAVFGGGLAGLAIGSLIKKPLEGAIVGALGGILIAETNRSRNTDTVIDRNTRMGAVFTREFRFDGFGSDDPWNRDRTGDDRWDRDRNRDRNRNDDWNRDDQWNRDRNRNRSDDWNRDDQWNRDRNRDDRWNDEQWGSYNPKIRYENRDLRFDGRERPYRLGNTPMLPLERTASQLGLRILDRDSRTIRLEGSYGNARFTRDSSLARIDGREISLSRPVVERDGILYVPAELFGRLVRENLYIDGTPIVRRSF